MVESKTIYKSNPGPGKRFFIPEELSNRLRSMHDFRTYFEDCRKYIFLANFLIISLIVCPSWVHVQQGFLVVTPEWREEDATNGLD